MTEGVIIFTSSIIHLPSIFTIGITLCVLSSLKVRHINVLKSKPRTKNIPSEKKMLANNFPVANSADFINIYLTFKNKCLFDFSYL
jgi:hypothetical protein